MKKAGLTKPKRLTKKRAEWLWLHRKYGSIPMGFKERCRVGTFAPADDGMTVDEFNHVRAIWATMGGDSSFMSAFFEIKNGRDADASIISDEMLRIEMETTKTLVAE